MRLWLQIDMGIPIGLAAELLNAFCVVFRAELSRTFSGDIVRWPIYSVNGWLLCACWLAFSCLRIRARKCGWSHQGHVGAPNFMGGSATAFFCEDAGPVGHQHAIPWPFVSEPDR